MVVILVMDTTIATKCFFPQSRRLGFIALILAMFLQIIVIFMSGCQDPISKGSPTLGHEIDITEDLYHRLKAGLFEAGKDPVICRIVKNPHYLFRKIKIPFYGSGKSHHNEQGAPHKMVRVSWERGSFWVKSDDHALIVIYMDVETVYSHVHITTLEGFNNHREFRHRNESPVR